MAKSTGKVAIVCKNCEWTFRDYACHNRKFCSGKCKGEWTSKQKSKSVIALPTGLGTTNETAIGGQKK